MKILVTGSNGLLGQKITDLVCSEYKGKIELVATGKGVNRYPHSEGFTYSTLDITNKEQVNTVISQHKPNVVIHGAAATNVDWCENNKEECINLNINATQYIASACKENLVHLVHLSTDFIFDGEKQLGDLYIETDIPKPVSHYGWSKLEAEKVVQNTLSDYSILRTVLVYGIVHDMSRSNVALWVKNNLEKGTQINVVNDQYRTPTLAEDLAKGCLLASLQKAKGIFNISGKDYLNIYELAQVVAKYFNLDSSLISPSSSKTLNQDAKRPARTGFDLTKARKELNYEPRSFEQGLAVLEVQLNNQKRDSL